MLAALTRALPEVHRYPDPYCRALRAAIAAAEGVPEEYILCGSGAAELIYAFTDAVRAAARRRARADVCGIFARARAARLRRGALYALGGERLRAGRRHSKFSAGDEAGGVLPLQPE